MTAATSLNMPHAAMQVRVVQANGLHWD